MHDHLNLDDARVQAALERVTSGDSATETVSVGGEYPMTLQISLHPQEPRTILFDCTAPGQPLSLRSVIFRPSASVPGGYPLQFPFVPGVLTTWSELGGSESHIAWATEDDAQTLFAFLQETVASAGWRRLAESPGFEGVLEQVAFSRGGRLRVLLLQSDGPNGLLSLLEMPEVQPGE